MKFMQRDAKECQWNPVTFAGAIGKDGRLKHTLHGQESEELSVKFHCLLAVQTPAVSGVLHKDSQVL